MSDTNATLIVIDGGANVGKATQSDMLMNRLLHDGYSVGKIDFPRYHQNTIGRLISDCIEGNGCDIRDLEPHVSANLFATDRFESKGQIEEWMAEGRIIIFDRYVTSNMLHQGAKIDDPDQREEFFRWVEHLEHEIFGMPRADLTVYLEVPPDESARLLEYVEQFGVKATGAEDHGKIHQAKVSECARYLANFHSHWTTVHCFDDNGLRPREDIHEEVYKIVSQHV